MPVVGKIAEHFYYVEFGLCREGPGGLRIACNGSDSVRHPINWPEMIPATRAGTSRRRDGLQGLIEGVHERVSKKPP